MSNNNLSMDIRRFKYICLSVIFCFAIFALSFLENRRISGQKTVNLSDDALTVIYLETARPAEINVRARFKTNGLATVNLPAVKMYVYRGNELVDSFTRKPTKVIKSKRGYSTSRSGTFALGHIEIEEAGQHKVMISVVGQQSRTGYAYLHISFIQSFNRWFFWIPSILSIGFLLASFIFRENSGVKSVVWGDKFVYYFIVFAILLTNIFMYRV